MDAKSFVSGMGVGALVLAFGMLLGGAAQATKPTAAAPAVPQDATFKTINVSALNVVNSKNDIVAAFIAADGGGTLRIFSDSGQPVVGMGVRGGGGRIGIGDKSGQERVRLNDDGSVEVLGDNGTTRASLTAFKLSGSAKSDFSGQFSAFDRNGGIVNQFPK